MKRKDRIEQEVEHTLQCFDQAEGLESNPFFYSRVQARINSLDRVRGQTRGWQMAWGVLRPALLVGILALNIITATVYWRGDDSGSSSRDQLLSSFAQEVGLDQSQLDLNTLLNE